MTVPVSTACSSLCSTGKLTCPGIPKALASSWARLHEAMAAALPEPALGGREPFCLEGTWLAGREGMGSWQPSSSSSPQRVTGPGGNGGQGTMGLLPWALSPFSRREGF